MPLPPDRIAVLYRMLPDSRPEQHDGECIVENKAHTGYEPTGPEQEAILNDNEHKTMLIAGGIRSGKSDTTALKAYILTMSFIAEHMMNPRKPKNHVAWIVADSYELTKPEMLEYLQPWILRTPIGQSMKTISRVDPGELKLTAPGGTFTIKTRSANDQQTLRAEAPVWTIVCEAGLLSYIAYMTLQGRMLESRARYPNYGQLIMSGTFENSVGWYASLWQKWRSEATQELENAISYSIPTHSNTYLFPGGEEDPQILVEKARLSPDAYKEQYLAIPAPPQGRVHHRFDPIFHIRKCEYDPELPVYLAIDPGYSGQPSHYFVGALQKKTLTGGPQWELFDEIWESGLTNIEICDVVKSRYWWKNSAITGTIDTAAVAHAGAELPAIEVWRKETGLNLRHQRVNLLPGIDRFNSMLEVDPLTKEPRFVIDPTNAGIISELGGGPVPKGSPQRPNYGAGEIHIYSWSQDREGNVIGTVPKDRYNDGIKACTYHFIQELGYATGRGLRRSIRVNSRSRKRRLAAI